MPWGEIWGQQENLIQRNRLWTEEMCWGEEIKISMGREWWDKSVFSLPSWGKIARSSEMLMILLLHLYDVLSLNPNFPYILLQISISFYSITSLQLSFKIHSILVAFQSLETLLHPELLNRPTTNCNLRLSIQMIYPRNRHMPIRYDLNLSPTAIFGTRNN